MSGVRKWVEEWRQSVTGPALRPGKRGAAEVGIHVLGAVSSATGQGVVCRAYVEALLLAGFPVRITDLDPLGNRGFLDRRFGHLASTNLDDCATRIGLLVTGAVGIPRAWEGPELRKALRVDAVVVNPWWELDRLPPDAVRALGTFHAVLAPTRFIEEVLKRHRVAAPIFYCPVPRRIPEVRPANRAAHGVPGQAVLVIASFDPASDPERKNPFGNIEAFQRAARDVPELHLLLKITNPHDGRDPFEALSRRVRSDAAAHGRIHLLEALLTEEETLALLGMADVYLSLHRAEGLGLGMLESMLLGRPVVTTGYSGNMSFMDEESGCLVPFSLVPARGSLASYHSVESLGPSWAEPDLHDAARWLVRLARDPALRTSKGDRAARAAQDYVAQASRLPGFFEMLRLPVRRRAVSVLVRRFRRAVGRSNH